MRQYADWRRYCVSGTLETDNTPLSFSPMGKRRLRESVLPLLASWGRMTSHEYPIVAAERKTNQCQHPKRVNPPSIRLLLVLLSQIWSKPWPFMDNSAL